MNKKPYKAPEVKKLHLEVKQAIMATCRLSSQPLSNENAAVDCLQGVLAPCIS